ncbi:MAG: D-alanine--D-alanine ligase [Oscillospiraceae bacterium]|nr:D-alanine--D-alanine ligase [Oscillospiraceae bacterium]
MKIAVLCGGLSSERDVSITSGTGIARALREKGHRVVLIDLFYGYKGEYANPAELFDAEQEDENYSVATEAPNLNKIRSEIDGSVIGKNVLDICREADICFLALHGDEGENGKLQATLDVHGIKYTGSGYLGSALAMNKELSKIMFRANGIPTPGGIIVEKGSGSYADVGFPCVVKPCSGGSSVGTSVVNCRDEYDAALELAFRYENRVVVERYIRGREFTVGVINGEAMPVIEIIPKNGWYDYKNKYQAGFTEEICPAEISPEVTEKVQSLAKKVGRALMIDVYYRADFLMDDADGEIYCLEANTLPGMTPTSLVPRMARAEGMDYGSFCEKIIKLSMEKYE